MRAVPCLQPRDAAEHKLFAEVYNGRLPERATPIFWPPLMTLLALYVEQGLCNGGASVRPSVRQSVPSVDISNGGFDAECLVCRKYRS